MKNWKSNNVWNKFQLFSDHNFRVLLLNSFVLKIQIRTSKAFGFLKILGYYLNMLLGEDGMPASGEVVIPFGLPANALTVRLYLNRKIDKI